MRHYEIVLLIHPDQSEQVPAMLDRYREMVGADAGKGLVHRVEDWGRRRLAYMINEVHKAHYVMLNVECGLETLRELEKNFKFNDSIIRSLVIRRERAVSEQSALAKAKAAEDREEARIQAEKKAARDRSDRDPKPARPAPTEPDPATETAAAAEPKADAGRDEKPDEKPEASPDESGEATRDAGQTETAAEKPAEDKSAEDKPAEDKPGESKPAEDKPEPDTAPVTDTEPKPETA